MSSTVNLASVKPSTSASQVILHAEPQHFVGRYRLLASQVSPHPSQRLLRQDWVDALHQRFVEVGIDRAAHPIKVLLENNWGLEHLTQAPAQASLEGFPLLPSDVVGLVYHGQHRIAACLKMEDIGEHWWYAEVYRKELETAFPAEFLTVMHSSNEDEYRLSTTDSDRFMVMYRLRQMMDENIITPEVYKANQERLERAVLKDSTRQGLKNLLRSPVLSHAVAQVLKHAHLRPGFNAATWGKKLTKGRFYRLVACLVEEMIEQCFLLRGESIQVASKPFQLSASSCERSKLQSSVKKKDHPWQELPGGVSGALARVSQRPETFINVLNPTGTDGWTFNHVILLPSVLTSDTVVTALTDMYVIAQHLIHMIAGEDVLNTYTGNRPQDTDMDHPVGVISMLLKERLTTHQSNYPDKIILHMWKNRAGLLEVLEKQEIGQAVQTTKEKYQQLISNHRSWWELLRMMKRSTLDTGLGLNVPKVFNPPRPMPLESEGRPGSYRPGPPESIQPASATTHTLPNLGATSEVQNQEEGTVPNNVDTRPTDNQVPSITFSSAKQPHNSERDGQPGPPLPGTPNPSRPSKRRKGDKDNATDDEDFYRLLTPPGSDSEGEEPDRVSQKRLRCHGRVSQQLQQLEQRVEHMQPEEARALESLLEAIADIQDTGHMARVVDALSAKAQFYRQRAERAGTVAQNFLLDKSGNGQ